MIHFLKGTLAEKNETSICVEVAGIGYEVFVPVTSGFFNKHDGEELMVYTYMAVKEDDISLYGFNNRESLSMFKKLITVNGVGAKAGISILSTLSTENLKAAIAFEDVDAIVKSPGIGKKTAQKIILDLKDKVKNSVNMAEVAIANDMVIPSSDIKEEAVNALVALGYSRNEARASVMGISKDCKTSEEIIKEALKKMF